MSNNEQNCDWPLILAIETATRAGGVAVAHGPKLLAARVGDASVSHSANLIEMAQGTLQDAGLALPDITVFVVAVGPGSFTGLRIGLATVKAFAVHLERKVVGISTLAAVAHASAVSGEIISLMPAGRGEVFAQRFSVHDQDISAVDEPQHLRPSDLINRYSVGEARTVTGDGVSMLEKLLPAADMPKEWNVCRQSPPLAPSVALLGFRAFAEGKWVAPDDLHAVYVRASDAEINERWQQQRQQQPAHG